MIHRTLIILCVAAVFAAVSSFYVSAFKSAVGPLKGTSSSAASRSTTLFAEKKAATKKKYIHNHYRQSTIIVMLQLRTKMTSRIMMTVAGWYLHMRIGRGMLGRENREKI